MPLRCRGRNPVCSLSGVCTCPCCPTQEEDDLQDEALLGDEPPARAPAVPPSAARPASDPLSRAAEAGAGYRDTYASLASQPLQHDMPREQHGVAGQTVLGASGPAAVTTPAGPQRHQGSHTLDTQEIGPAGSDAGFLRASSSTAPAGGAASNGASPSSAPSTGSARSVRQYHITVSDPVRRIGDSMIPGFTSTHTEYLVASTAVGESGSGREQRRSEVRRRFKDFVVSVAWVGCSLRSCTAVAPTQRMRTGLLNCTWGAAL